CLHCAFTAGLLRIQSGHMKAAAKKSQQVPFAHHAETGQESSFHALLPLVRILRSTRSQSSADRSSRTPRFQVLSHVSRPSLFLWREYTGRPRASASSINIEFKPKTTSEI